MPKFLSRLDSPRTMYVLLALAFGVSMLLVRQNLQMPLAPDEREYVARAQAAAVNLWQDREVYRPPLFPYTLALWFQLVGQARFGVGIFQTFFYLVGITLVYQLTRQLFSPRALALTAAAAFALYPHALSSTGTYLTEPLSVSLLLAGFVAVLHASRARRADPALLGGIFLALSALTREVVAYFALLIVPLWWLVFVSSPRRTRILQSALFGCGLLLVLVPWVVRNYAVEQRFLLLSTSSEYIFARDNGRIGVRMNLPSSSLNTDESTRDQLRAKLETLPPNERAGYLYRVGFESIGNLGVYWLGHKAAMLRGFWSPFEFERANLGLNELPGAVMPIASLAVTAYLAALVVFATIGLVTAPPKAENLLVALFVVYSLALFILTHYQMRYRYPVFVLLLPYAAFGMWSVAGIVRERNWKALGAPRMLLALGLIGLFSLVVWDTMV